AHPADGRECHASLLLLLLQMCLVRDHRVVSGDPILRWSIRFHTPRRSTTTEQFALLLSLPVLLQIRFCTRTRANIFQHLHSTLYARTRNAFLPAIAA